MEDDRLPGLEAVAAQLDAAHEVARRAYAAKDVAAYVATFHPELQYTRRDGRTIGREHLAREIGAQLARVEAAATEFRREQLDVGAHTATEVLEQRATYQVRAFRVVRRAWEVRRRGRYEWAWAAGRWTLRRVTVLEESVRPLRTWLAFR